MLARALHGAISLLRCGHFVTDGMSLQFVDLRPQFATTWFELALPLLDQGSPLQPPHGVRTVSQFQYGCTNLPAQLSIVGLALTHININMRKQPTTITLHVRVWWRQHMYTTNKYGMHTRTCRTYLRTIHISFCLFTSVHIPRYLFDIVLYDWYARIFFHKWGYHNIIMLYSHPDALSRYFSIMVIIPDLQVPCTCILHPCAIVILCNLSNCSFSVGFSIPYLQCVNDVALRTPSSSSE